MGDRRSTRSHIAARALALLAVALEGSFACAPANVAAKVTPTPTPTTRSAECAAAEKERARASSMLDAGRLDRALRVLEHADALCAKESSKSARARLDALAALHRDDEAIALASALDRDPAATREDRDAASKARAVVAGDAMEETAAAGDRARELRGEADRRGDDPTTAKGLYLASWAARHPNGEALWGAARASFALHEGAETQRLIDRALFELEQASGVRARVVFREALTRSAPIWARGGAVAASFLGDEITIEDGTTLAPTGHLHCDGPVRELAFAPDGKTIAAITAEASGAPARIETWSIATAARLRIENAHAPATLTYGADGVYLAVLEPWTGVRAWTAATGEPAKREMPWDGPPVPGAPFAFGAGGKTLVSFVAGAPNGSDPLMRNDDLLVHDLATGKLLRTIKLASLPLNAGFDTSASLLLSPDGARAVSIDSTLGGAVFDVKTGASLPKIAAPGVLTAGRRLLSRDGGLLYWASDDGVVHAFDTGKRVERYALSPIGGAGELELAAAGDWLVTHGTMTRLWDAGTGAALRAIDSADDDGAAAAFSPDGNTLISGALDGTLRMWDLAAGAMVATTTAHDGPVRAIALQKIAGATVALSAARDGLRAWALPSGAPMGAFGSNSGSIAAVAASIGGRVVATGASDGVVQIWETAPRTLRARIEVAGAVRAIALSSEGAYVAVANEIGDALVFDAGTGKRELMVGHETLVSEAISFSPDSWSLAIGGHPPGSRAGGGRVVTIQDGTTSSTFSTSSKDPSATRAISAIAYSPDGAWLAIGEEGGSVWIRELAGSRVQPSTSVGGRVAALVWSPSGTRLAAATKSSVAIVHAMTGATLVTLHALEGGAGVATTDAAYEPFGEVTPRLECSLGGARYPLFLCAERAGTPGLLAHAFSDAPLTDP